MASFQSTVLYEKKETSRSKPTLQKMPTTPNRKSKRSVVQHQVAANSPRRSPRHIGARAKGDDESEGASRSASREEANNGVARTNANANANASNTENAKANANGSVDQVQVAVNSPLRRHRSRRHNPRLEGREKGNVSGSDKVHTNKNSRSDEGKDGENTAATGERSAPAKSTRRLPTRRQSSVGPFGGGGTARAIVTDRIGTPGIRESRGSIARGDSRPSGTPNERGNSSASGSSAARDGISLTRRQSNAPETLATERLRHVVDPDAGTTTERRQPKTKVFHTLTNNSKNLLSYLKNVPDGIKQAAQTRGITLDPRDLSMLESFGGDCPHYVPWGSKQGIALRQTKANVGKSREELIQIYSLKNIHIVDKSPRFSPNLADRTSGNYESCVRTFWNFLAYMGRYEEMVILLPHAPEIPDDVVPSITPKSICEFVHHRFEHAQLPLRSAGASDGEQIRDCKGVAVTCEGTVKNEEWLDSTFAAISYIHDKALKGNKYVPACEQCLSEAGQNLCQSHSGHGKSKKHYTRNQGDPTKSREVDEVKGWLIRVSKERQYEPKRRAPFLPGDIRTFHRELDRKNFEIRELERYVAMLTAINVAGRWDGYSSMDIENNLNATSRHWVIQDNRVLSYAIRIKEKTDDDHVTHRIHFNDDVPHMCWGRLILIYLHCSGLGSGYLFPHHEQLQQARNRVLETQENSFTSTMPMDYRSFVHWIHDLKKLCKGGHLANWGPHSTRCTKYLFDFIGGANIHLAAKTARHKSYQVALKYLNDSLSIRDIIREHPVLREVHRVPAYRDTIISGNGENVERALLELPNLTRDVSDIKDVAKVLVEKMLGVSPQSVHYRDPAFLLKRSYSISLAAKPNDTDLHISQIRALVPENQQYSLLQSYEHVTKQAQHEAEVQRQEALEEQQRLLQSQLAVEARQKEADYALRQKEATEQWQDRKHQQYEARSKKMQEDLERDKAAWIQTQEKQISEWWAKIKEEWSGLASLPDLPPDWRMGCRKGSVVGEQNPNPLNLLADAVGDRPSRTSVIPPGGTIPATPHKRVAPLGTPAAVEAAPRPTPSPCARGSDNVPPSTLEGRSPANAPGMAPRPTPSPTARANREGVDATNTDSTSTAAAPPRMVIPVEGDPHAPSPANGAITIRRAPPMAAHVIPAARRSVPLFSGRLLQVRYEEGSTTATIKEETKARIKSSKGKAKASVIAELMLEISELSFDASLSHGACYGRGMKILFESLPEKQDRNNLSTYIGRTLKPVQNHFFECSKGRTSRFLDTVPHDFKPINFVAQGGCVACQEESLSRLNKARTNAHKEKKTMVDILSPKTKRPRNDSAKEPSPKKKQRKE